MAIPTSKPQLSLQAAHLYDDAAGIPDNHWCRGFFEHIYCSFDDADFAGLYRHGGRYPVSPSRLACISILQYMFSVSDRVAVENTIMRRDWRIALGLTPDYAGFDPSVLCNFRKRLRGHGQERLIFEAVLARLAELGALKGVKRVRVDATELLANVAVLSRGDMLQEAMRIVIRDLRAARPKLLRRPDFLRLYERYGQEVWLGGAIDSEQKLLALARDAQALLRLCGPYQIAGKETLERILEENFRFEKGRDPELKPPEELPPDHVASPHEPDAEVGKNGDKIFTGDKVHFTETVPESEPGAPPAPGFLIDVTVTGPRVPDVNFTPELAFRLRTEHPELDTILADSGYASAHNSRLAAALGLDLVSPPRANNTRGIYPASRFELDFARQVARCPKGHESASWSVRRKLKIKFSRQVCAACPCRAACTTSPNEGRSLTLCPDYDQLLADRARAARPEFAKLYKKRAGIEATISELVHRCGLRRSRYRGSPGRRLHALLAATALNVRRLLRAAAAGDGPQRAISCVFAALQQRLRSGYEGFLRPLGPICRAAKAVGGLSA